MGAVFDETTNRSNFRPTAASILGARVRPKQETVGGLSQVRHRLFSQHDFLTNFAEAMPAMHRLTNELQFA